MKTIAEIVDLTAAAAGATGSRPITRQITRQITADPARTHVQVGQRCHVPVVRTVRRYELARDARHAAYDAGGSDADAADAAMAALAAAEA